MRIGRNVSIGDAVTGLFFVSIPCLVSCGNAASGEPTCAGGTTSEECGLEGEQTLPTGRTSQPLYSTPQSGYLWGSADTWASGNTTPNARTDIQVCWENDPNAFPGFTQQQILTWLDTRQGIVQRTWSRYARLNTSFWGACSSGLSGIHVRACTAGTSWTNPDGSTSNCPDGGWVGVNNDGTQLGEKISGKPNGLRISTDELIAVFDHEFGHALGFVHDEVRHKANGGTRTDGTYPCSSEMIGTQFKYDVAQFSQPIFTGTNAVTYGGFNWGTNAGNTGFPFEWSSIMAYCHNPVDRPAPYLNHYDVASVQRIYGRRQRGTLLSMRAFCTEMAGTQVLLSGFNCDEFLDVQEFIPFLSDGDAWNLQTTNTDGTTKCIAPTSAADGAAVTPQTCSTSTDWRFQSMNLVGYGGLCLDLSNGSLTAGNTINMWSCGMGFGANQVWTRTRDGLIKFGTTNWCAELDAAAGGRLRLQVCNTSNSRQIFSFSFPNHGQISRWNGSAWECLDVQGPSDAQFHPTSGLGAINGPGGGASVNAVACNTALNQRWNLNGTLKLGANANLCLHRDTDAPNQLLSLRTCAFTENQVWDYYF